MLFIVPYHVSDSVLWLRRTIAQLKKQGDVLLVTDNGVKKITTFSDTPQLVTDGMGVGRARDAGVKWGVKNGYDCLIFSDSHMIVPDVSTLCDHDLAQPQVEAVGANSSVVGDFLGEWDWKWYYISRTVTKRNIMTTEPMFSLTRDVAEALISANGGWYTPVFYWGKENFDPTLSATRLGFQLDLVPEVKVGHVYKEGSPKGWRRRFVLQGIDRNEPWYNKIIVKSPYMFSISFGDAIHAIRHYNDQEIKRLLLDKTALQLARETWGQSAKEFERNAKYTRRQAYQLLEKYLEGAEYYKVT